MGSIPLVATGLRPAEHVDPLQEYQRAAQLGIQRQQQQALEQENQQRDLALKDQQAMTQAMHDWDGQDIEALPSLVLKRGGSANAVFGMQQQILKRKQDLAGLDKDQLANMKSHHDAALSVIDAAKQVPDEQLSQHISDSVQQLQTQGHLSPIEARNILGHAQQMQPSEFRPWLDVYEKGLLGESRAFEEAQKTQEVENKKQEVAVKQQEANAKDWKDFPTLGVSLNTRTGETKQVGGGMVPPAMADTMYRDIEMRTTRKQPVSDDEKAWAKAYEKQKTLGPRAQIALQGGLLNDAAKEMAAQYYEQTGQLPAGMRSPAMSAGILNKAATGAGGVPDIATNKRTYAAQSALQKSATSGKIAANLTAFNTAIEHAKQLQDAADALDNMDIPKLNKIGNVLGYNFGSDKTTNFNVIKNALAGEISKVFKGGEATDAEIKEVQKPFDAANSPKQLKGAIQNAIRLMNSKRDALKQQYDTGMSGKPNFGETPAGGNFFEQFGGKPR